MTVSSTEVCTLLIVSVISLDDLADWAARNIENEIAYQREITDEAKNALKA